MTDRTSANPFGEPENTEAPTAAGITLLDHALALAEKGFHVFPLRPLTKKPATHNGHKAATRSVTQIRQWWANDPNQNIGISTERFGDTNDALIVVDVDVRDGKRGAETLRDLEDQLGPLPATYTQTTATGGKHYVFIAPRNDISSGADKLGPGVDIKTGSAYIVGAGSIMGGGEYRA